jgi:hypothetical protein
VPLLLQRAPFPSYATSMYLSVYVTFHASKAATELVRSKTEFEEFLARFNVQIKNTRADNAHCSAV